MTIMDDVRTWNWLPDVGKDPDAAPTADVDIDQETAADEAAPSTWLPIDLTAILDGTYVPEEPALMRRSDGVRLVYQGRVHSFHGESESGKSMVAQAVCAETLNDGGAVLYLDFESDAGVVVDRIVQMGADKQVIAERFHYLRPDARPDATDDDRTAFVQILKTGYALAIIDGVTEAAAVFGVSSKDNDELTAWIRTFVRRIAKRTGAAVIQVDHVTKDSDTRGRFAIGAQAKMSALDGAGYLIEVKEPLGRRMRGVVAMRVVKDRPGSVRPECGKYRATDRSQEAARVVIDSTVERQIRVSIEPMEPAAGDAMTDGGFRPTELMERVSRYIESQASPPSENKILSGVVGKDAAIKKAIDTLVDEGYVKRMVGPRKATLHQILANYRQIEDPRSDKYRPERAEVDPSEPPPGLL